MHRSFISAHGIERFVSMKRVCSQHKVMNVPAFQAALEDVTETMCQEGVKHMHNIHEYFDMKDIKPEVALQLPFQCKTEFHDPRQPDKKGHCLLTYPLKEDKERKFHICHCNLADVALPHAKTKTEAPQHVDMD